MKNGFVDTIQGLGHWRVNYRPIGEIKEMQLSRLKEIVREATVSIRGWDYPHFNHREDVEGGFGNFAEYYENWTDWNGFQEFWRIYRSAQFIYYSVLHEDTPQWGEGSQPGAALNVIAAQYTIFEFLEFAHRMAQRGPYGDGVIFDLRLLNTAGRHLVAGRNRMPFFDRKRFDGPEIKFRYSLSALDLIEKYQARAVDVCLDLFDRFDWAPPRDQIENEQRKFYDRLFSF